MSWLKFQVFLSVDDESRDHVAADPSYEADK